MHFKEGKQHHEEQRIQEEQRQEQRREEEQRIQEEQRQEQRREEEQAMHIEEQQGTIAMQKMRGEAQARIIQNQATLVRSIPFPTFRLKLGRWLGLDRAKQWQDKAEEERMVVLKYHLRLKSWKHKVFIHRQ